MSPLYLPEYELKTKIRETRSAALFRAFRRKDQRRVVIKVLSNEYPSSVEIARLRHEHAILSSLDLPRVVKTFGLVRAGNRLALVLEDVGKRSLDKLIRPGGLDLKTFLEVAVGLANTVECIHQHKIIHKDIKPEHFFQGAAAGDLKLIDFGIATLLPHEEQRAVDPSRIEGTLKYMSPEQTGRMNRPLDKRTDLYSLGVTLYELLCGMPPFDADDALELVHSHVARTPPVPHEIRRDVPPVLSDIVRKLLAKAPEDRYQDAAGLRVDLEFCLQQLEQTAEVLAFPLGEHDVRSEIRIPQRLYGRESESAKLLAAFERIRNGAAELFLVTGPTGIGKSALVKGLHKQLVHGAYFVTGKFDQFWATPYSAIVDGCRDLVRSVLASPPDALAIWKREVQQAVGRNGQLVIDLIPELEKVIGPQVKPPSLDANEAHNRFDVTFQNFLKVFASPGHPVVFFLDDLQWADAASVRLLHLLLTQPDCSYLLVIGAYRHGEGQTSDPLRDALGALREARATVNEVALDVLDLSDIRRLLGDALGCDEELAEPLAELTLRKTRGNPYFVWQFLTTLHTEKLLTFDKSSNSWMWDLETVKTARATDNVVDLFVHKLERLGAATRGVLELASCIGNRFDFKTLSLLADCTTSEVAESLLEALREGLIVALDGNYRYVSDLAFEPTLGFDVDALNAYYSFLHDRVQLAVYATFDERKQKGHLKIGRLLLAAKNDAPKDDELFEIVKHLNLALPLITDPIERQKLSQLDMMAARRARATGAHSVAAELLGVTLHILSELGFAERHAVAFEAYSAKAQSEFALGQHQAAFALLDDAESHAMTVLERMPARELRISFLTALNRLPEAVSLARATIRLLGVDLPDEPAEIEAAIALALDNVNQRLQLMDKESLLALPVMTDPVGLSLLSILFKAAPAAYQYDQRTLLLCVLRAMQAMLTHGNAPVSAYVYAVYGIAQSSLEHDHRQGHQFGQLALELNHRLPDSATEGACNLVFASSISHWQVHISESLQCFRRAFDSWLVTAGAVSYQPAKGVALYYRLCAGANLAELGDDVKSQTASLKRAGDVTSVLLLLPLAQGIAHLRGTVDESSEIGGADLDRATLGRALTMNPMLAQCHNLIKVITDYTAGNYRGAFETVANAPFLQGSLFYVTEHYLYRALACAALARTALGPERETLLETLREAERTLAGWKASCKANHAHRHALVAAEQSDLMNAPDAAMDLYDAAIVSAQENGFIHHVALANELCAKFHHRRGRTKVAKSYLSDACYTYQEWGSRSKVAALTREYSELLGHALENGTGAAELTSFTITEDLSNAPGSGTFTVRFDLVTAIRAAQAITSELVLDRLVERLMRTVLANAGAQKGVLVLQRGGTLELAAVMTVDPDEIRVNVSQELHKSKDLATTVVQYVARTEEAVVLENAAQGTVFAHDPYISERRPKSLLCIPMLHQRRLAGLLYLENSTTTGVFSRSRVGLLQFVATQAAVALENALLYQTLEQRVQDRTLELEKAYKENLEIAHRAGMAEIATAVLHNVGNVLNSVNVSTDLVATLVQQSKVSDLVRAAQLFRVHADDLAHFITHDAQGKHLAPYMISVSEHLAKEQTKMRNELALVKKFVGHIKDIVAMQQSYAGIGGVREKVLPESVLEDAISIHLPTAERGNFELVRQYEATGEMFINKHKLIQILVNLISNAKDSLLAIPIEKRKLTLRIVPCAERVKFQVVDTGIGIPPEVMPRIFSHGFTTKPHGHGFGLHNSALAASELGGSLTAESNGAEQGACFTLELPCRVTDPASERGYPSRDSLRGGERELRLSGVSASLGAPSVLTPSAAR